MYKFRINKKNSNIYLINDNINNKNLEYKKILHLYLNLVIKIQLVLVVIFLIDIINDI